MKKNIALFAGVVSFVLLFYKQEVAMNLSIFSLLVWLVIFLVTGKKYYTNTFWWLSAAVFICAGAFAWYGDFASFIALFFTLALFIIKAFYPKLNILAAPFIMLISGGTSLVRMLLVKNWITLPKGVYNNFWRKAIAYVVVPLFFAIIFMGLYSIASQKFASYLNFNWDLTNVGIIAGLSALGFFFMFNFIHLFVPRFIVKENYRLSDNFSSSGSHRRLLAVTSGGQSFQRRSGEISLLLLNIILVFFILVYASESIQNLSPDISYSSEVHERVYVIIGSIVIAVAIIMIYFYSPSNFGKEAKLLRTLSYVWITLNAALVIIAMLKTGEYVAAYGLTFKRVGVYAFLILSLIGLVITSYKLMFVKTNIYLLNRMVWVFFAAMIIGFNINWSWVVTKYNITHQKKPDVGYLSTLDYNKKIMFETFGDNQTWEENYNSISELLRHEKNKSFLSSRLYYQFLNLKR